MFAKIISALVFTIILTSVGFAEEPAKTVQSPAVAAPSVSTAPTLQAGAKNASVPVSGVPTKVKPNRAITISMFATIIGITLCVVIWAARSTKSAADFYTAGGGITGLQNGWAIAGDYMSAAMAQPFCKPVMPPPAV